MIRQRVSLAVAGAFVASSAFTLGIAAPAGAAVSAFDPTFVPTTGDLVGGGSDTSEVALDYLAKGHDGIAGFNGTKPTGRIASYAATGDPAELTLRDGSKLKRPNNSGTGRATLWGTGNNANFDYARSSSSIPPAEAETLRQIPFAVDGLRMAVASTSNAPDTISAADVVRIYKGEVTNWSQIGGKSGVIKPLIPFSGSGTRSFFESQLNAANGATVTIDATKVKETQEHSDTDVKGDPNAIAPFSTGRAKSATTIKLVDGFSAKRALFNVVRAADYTTGAPKASLLQSVFSQTGFVCSPAARPLIEAAGFEQLASVTNGGVCGEPVTTNISNFRTSGQAGAAVTTTTLKAAALNGGTVRLTADVSATGLNPAGKVQFREGDSLVSTVNVAGGQAIATLTGVTPGARSYTATFVPNNDNAFAPSTTTNAVSATMLISSSLTVSVSPASSTFGTARTVTVTGKQGGNEPLTGVVRVAVPGVSTTNVTLANGTARVTIPATATPARRAVTATYAGSSSVFGTSAGSTVTITKAKTASTLKLSKKKIKASKKAKATVTVKVSGSSIKASGKVTLKAGSKVVGTGTVKNGKASVTLKKLKKGTYKIKATFAGGASYASSATKTVTLKVTK